MTRAARTWLYRLGLAIGGTLLLAQFVTTFQLLADNTLRIVDLRWAGTALALVGLAHVVQIGAWRRAMNAMNVALPLGTTVGGYVLSFVPRYLPGTIWGYLSRGEWLQREFGVNQRTSAIGSGLEIVLSVLSALVVGGLYSAVQGIHVPAGTGAVAVLAITAASLLPASAFGGQPRGAGYQPTPRTRFVLIAAGFLFYLGFWSAHGLALWAIANALAIAPMPDWIWLTASFCVAWLVGFVVVIVPSGLGIREAALASLLSSTGGFAPTAAMAVAVGGRASILLVELLMLVGWLVIRRGVRLAIER